ncbi:MAG TPA: sensor histidine kinase [Chitinophagaceae bacterium]|nr:sensor histidine kinase [Chitinophagaceae bacterium]
MEKSANTIIIVISILTLVAAFVIAYIVYFIKRKSTLIEEKNALKEEFKQQLRQSQVEVQEHTFQQIGKELHDNVGQLLITSKMLLGLTERSLGNPPDMLITANATLGQAINELRSLSKMLDREWLEQFNFNNNLKTEIDRINTGNAVQAEFNYSGNMPLKAEAQIILFRIVQEAIQNAIKHGRADKIIITAAEQNDEIHISVADNGRGFSSAEKTGMGLSNMRHRANLLGGTIAWDSIPENGTTVKITLPISKEA